MSSVSRSQSMPWLSSMSSNEFISKKNNFLHLVYPLFSTLAEDVDDPHWKVILTDCSKGKLPKGFTFNGKTLMYGGGSKYLEILNNPNASRDFINFVRANTGIRSKMDLEREKDSEREGQKDYQVKKWNEIRSKASKRLLIIDYTTNIKLKYNLTSKEVDQLITTLNSTIKEPNAGQNITMTEAGISEISNLSWDPSTRKFSLIGNRRNHEVRHQSNENVEYTFSPLGIENVQISTLKEWNKFLKQFNKSVGKINQNKIDQIKIEQVKVEQSSIQEVSDGNSESVMSSS